MAIAYGRILPSYESAPILDYYGVNASTDIGETHEVVYNGVTYWIMQRGVKFPNPSDTSPDGWHIVYQPSDEELELSNLPGMSPADLLPDLLGGRTTDILEQALKLGGFALLAYLGVNIVKAFTGK